MNLFLRPFQPLSRNYNFGSTLVRKHQILMPFDHRPHRSPEISTHQVSPKKPFKMSQNGPYRVTIKEWPPKEWISKKSTLFTFFCSFERKGWPKQTKSTLFYHHGYGNIKHKHLICCKMPISIVIGEKIMDTNFSSILYKMSIKTC